MKVKSQEDEFYNDLDKKSLHRSCCTFQTMILLFVFLLIVAISGTFYLYKEIKKINISSKIITATFENRNSFNKKISLDSHPAVFEIAVTSEELTAVLSEGISAQNFIIKNIQAIIDNNGINIYGTLVKPLSSQIKIETVPKVEQGKVKFTVNKITAGKLTLPKFITNQVENALNKAMDQNFTKLYENYEVQNINLFIDKMIISGKLK